MIEEDELMRDIADPLRGCRGILKACLITLGMAVFCIVGYLAILTLTGNLG